MSASNAGLILQVMLFQLSLVYPRIVALSRDVCASVKLIPMRFVKSVPLLVGGTPDLLVLGSRDRFCLSSIILLEVETEERGNQTSTISYHLI